MYNDENKDKQEDFKMTDLELIKYLCELIWDMVGGGTPEDTVWKILENELRKRGLDPEEIFGY